MHDPVLQLLGELVIFLSKRIRQSIAFNLLVYFIISGSLCFGGLYLVFYINSSNFAELALKAGYQGLTSDMENSIYLDENNKLRINDSELMLKWGFDNLYSNLGYRLIVKDTNEVLLVSANLEVVGAIINKIDIHIPVGYSEISDSNFSMYRKEVTFGNDQYYLDLARSDLLGELANEAVLPALVDVSLFAVFVSSVIFLTANFVAIRLIVKPVKSLSSSVGKISTVDLSDRIATENVPNELLPIVAAFNQALVRVEQGFEQQKRFVADAAHELRTPLTVLLSRIELSLEDNELKKKLTNDARYLSRIVEQLLDLSRAQNRLESSINTVDLITIAKNMCGLLAPLALDNEQELEISTNLKVCEVRADEGELSVVVKNLVENAIRHTPKGSKIKVSISKNTLSIEDSGFGIPVQSRNRVFDRFYRVNQSDLSGSGLGLAITKELLSHFNASISVTTSQTLGGAHFKVTFG